MRAALRNLIWLGFAAFALGLAANAGAQPGSASTAPLVAHLLDYVSVDYPEFVKDGKVLDEGEYKEQQEFAAQVIELLGALPAVPARPALLEQAAALKDLIDAKAQGTEVSSAATALRWRVVEAYGIAVAPKSPPDMRRAASVYAAQCAACHGAEGKGDGPAGKGLDPAPSNFHDRDRMAQRSLYGLYNTVSLGVEGTSMKGFGELTDEERWALAFYVDKLGAPSERAEQGEALWRKGVGKKEVGTLSTVATLNEVEIATRFGDDMVAVFAWLKANPSALSAGRESPIAYSRRLLAESVNAYRAGQRDEAQRLALTSYLEGFELAEASLDAIDRPLRQEVETQMIGYRDLMRRGATVEEVAQAADRVDRLLETAAQKLHDEGLTPSAAAAGAFFILLREGLEALLVVTAIIALLVKAGRREALPYVHAGWLGALGAGLLTWFIAATLIEVSGATRELTEGVTALAAAAILVYVGVWLHDKSHARAWQAFVDRHLTSALERGTLWALAGVSFLAVYREAFETVLFYQALLQQAGDDARASVFMGLAAGILVLALLAWLILRYSVRLPLGLFFGASSVLLGLLAVVFTGHGVRALQEAGVIPASPIDMGGFRALGVYATVETTLAQIVVLLLVVAAFVFTRAANRRAIAPR